MLSSFPWHAVLGWRWDEEKRATRSGTYTLMYSVYCRDRLQKIDSFGCTVAYGRSAARRSRRRTSGVEGCAWCRSPSPCTLGVTTVLISGLRLSAEASDETRLAGLFACLGTAEGHNITSSHSAKPEGWLLMMLWMTDIKILSMPRRDQVVQQQVALVRHKLKTQASAFRFRMPYWSTSYCSLLQHAAS